MSAIVLSKTTKVWPSSKLAPHYSFHEKQLHNVAFSNETISAKNSYRWPALKTIYFTQSKLTMGSHRQQWNSSVKKVYKHFSEKVSKKLETKNRWPRSHIALPRKWTWTEVRMICCVTTLLMRGSVVFVWFLSLMNNWFASNPRNKIFWNIIRTIFKAGQVTDRTYRTKFCKHEGQSKLRQDVRQTQSQPRIEYFSTFWIHISTLSLYG